MKLAYMPAKKIEAVDPAEKQGSAAGTVCGDCKTENLRNRRFCSSCGSALEAACQVCSFVNAGTDRFCGGCGDDLREAGHRDPAKKTAKAPPAGAATPVQAEHDSSIESLFHNPVAMPEEKAVDPVVSQHELDDLFERKM